MNNNNNYFKSFEELMKVKDKSLYTNSLSYILNDIFPAPNTPWGILFYCLILIIIKIIFSYFIDWYAEKYGDQEEELKAIPAEISEKILERRKQKAKEAIEILKRIN